jgi:hypothetical protein
VSTTAPTGITLDLRRAQHRTAGVAAWGTKTDAVAALADLRARGINTDRDIEIHRAETHLTRCWVIGRPDHYNGITYLMTSAGSWVAGRLTDVYSGAVPWTSLHREPAPATIAHVTRTVSDGGNQRERYKTKSNGSCGRWVRSDESVALCTCGWKKWASSRAEAQSAARAHRDNPAPASTERSAA